MTLISKKTSWQQMSLLATAVAAIAISTYQPAEADYRRSCRAQLEVRAAGTNTVRELYQWRVYNSVTYYHEVNEARRQARRAIANCMRTHWNARDSDTVPRACQSHGSLEFRDYPFVRLADRLRDDLCAESAANVDLVLFIDGERGCVVDGGNINPATRVNIVSNYRVNCPVPDAGTWECVGEGCEPPLQGIRLPGNDLAGGIRPTPGQGWRNCEQMCEDTTECRAWTWRRAGSSGPGSSEMCLLKSGERVRVTDPCCHSGTRD
jgi:hypothetical protein